MDTPSSNAGHRDERQIRDLRVRSSPTTRRSRLARRCAAVLAGVSTLGLAGGASAATSGSGHGRHVVPLVFYSSIGYDQLAATDFTKRFHIPVEVEHNATGAALDQIEASRNDPKWDFWWTDGPTNFALLDSQHMLVRGFEPKVDWNALGREAVPRDGSYVPTGVTIAAALVYDRQRVPHPPTSWLQLLDPQWKGKVGMNDPSISGPTYPFVAGTMQYLGGISAGESYFKALKANGLLVEPKNGPTLAALASGEIDVALVQSTAAVGATFSDHALGVEYLSPSTLLPSAIGIDAKAPALARSEAEKFVEYMLSPAGQRVMEAGDPTGDSLYYPVIHGIRARSALRSLASVETITVDPYTWGAREGAIDTWFTQNVVQ